MGPTSVKAAHKTLVKLTLSVIDVPRRRKSGIRKNERLFTTFVINKT